MPERIYLDCNATAPLRPAVREVMLEVLSRVGNPSSVHAEGRAARAKREAAREAVAAAIGARPSEIIFTSGGTEANALGLLGAARRSLLVSAGEHPSVLEADRATELVPLRRDGRLDCAALAELLDRAGSDAVLLSVQLANNETGVIQPMAEVVEIARSAGAMIHCDAIQAMGKIAVDVKALGADFLSLSAHKMGGPQAVGALWVADGHELQPLQRGGGQELRRRAGTENLPGIVGFGKAAELVLSELEEMAARRVWRDAMEQRVLAAEPQAQILGLDAPRLPNTS